MSEYIKSHIRRHDKARAEFALGREFLPTYVLHHHDLEQLVICEDREYHDLLTLRERAYYACGDSHKRKCYLCQVYDDVKNLHLTRGISRSGYYIAKYYHIECNRKHGRETYKKAKENLIKKCAVCCWCWEDFNTPLYCRLCLDPNECEGPNESVGSDVE